MKMIWDQRNSTPVIQHFSPKLLGLSYQLGRDALWPRASERAEWPRHRIRRFPREIGAPLPVLFTPVQEGNMFENKVPRLCRET